jgi:hypothetical protein
VKMRSHRAGRWAFDERYARILIDEGYTVDCSVTPFVNWAGAKGDPTRGGGTDYRGFPSEPYWIDPTDIGRAGNSPLLEVPATVLYAWPTAMRGVAARTPRVVRRLANKLYPEVRWLRPTGRNRRDLLRTVERVASGDRSYAEFVLHSSELMPGGSPVFPTEESIEALYADLEALFSTAAASFRGGTLTEFRDFLAAAEGRDSLGGKSS